MSAKCVVVVSGGVVEVYCDSALITAQVIDMDNLDCSGESINLPKDQGYEALIQRAGIDEFVDWF